MNNRYFIQLAFQSINKHRQTYFPYMIAVSFFVSMVYLLLFLRDNVNATAAFNTTVFYYLLSLAVYLFGVFVVIFLIYSNGFLIRPRTKEFGLLYLLGLSQRHLLMIMFYEVVITYTVSIVFGLTFGMVLSRLMGMVLSALIKLPVIMQQVIDTGSLLLTAVLFLCIMGVVLIINMMKIIVAKPITLVRHVDRAPLSPWVQYSLLFLGIISIAYAYWVIIAIDSPQRAYESMAFIIITIIVGTYCLFVSLSVTVLQILEKRPTFYYRANNLIIINGLLNRIRQNAVGLASVSMFALLILAMVSTAGVIYFGANESVQKMYVADVVLTIQEHNIQSKSQLREQIEQAAQSHGVTVDIKDIHSFISLSAIQKENTFEYQMQNRVFVGDSKSHFFVLITASEYNNLYEDPLILAPGEVAVYSSYRSLPDTFVLQGREYLVVKKLPELLLASYELQQLVNAHFVVVHDLSELIVHERNKYQQNNDYPSPIRYRMGINIQGTDEQKLAVYQRIKSVLMSDEIISKTQKFPNPHIEIVNIQSRQAEKLSFESVYGTFLFLSLSLGVLFMLSTALIIYYKQLSEGYEDKTRFEILQRIGMTRDEVRTSVDKQIVVLFWIPLVVASINFCILLNFIDHLIKLFRIESQQLLVVAAFVTLLTFTLLYLVIYRLSARVYYHIVR